MACNESSSTSVLITSLETHSAIDVVSFSPQRFNAQRRSDTIRSLIGDDVQRCRAEPRGLCFIFLSLSHTLLTKTHWLMCTSSPHPDTEPHRPHICHLLQPDGHTQLIQSSCFCFAMCKIFLPVLSLSLMDTSVDAGFESLS